MAWPNNKQKYEGWKDGGIYDFSSLREMFPFLGSNDKNIEETFACETWITMTIFNFLNLEIRKSYDLQ